MHHMSSVKDDLSNDNRLWKHAVLFIIHDIDAIGNTLRWPKRLTKSRSSCSLFVRGYMLDNFSLHLLCSDTYVPVNTF